MGRLSWQKDVRQVDVRALTEGLPAELAELVGRAWSDTFAQDEGVPELKARLRALTTKGIAQ